MLFSKSVEKLNLVDKTYIGDGDNKGYATVSKSMPCRITFSLKKKNAFPLLLRENKGNKRNPLGATRFVLILYLFFHRTFC